MHPVSCLVIFTQPKSCEQLGGIFQTQVSIEVPSYTFLYQTKDKNLNLPAAIVPLTLYGKDFLWYYYAKFFRPKLLIQSELDLARASIVNLGNQQEDLCYPVGLILFPPYPFVSLVSANVFVGYSSTIFCLWALFV